METEQKPHLLVISGYYWRDHKDHVTPYVCKMFPYFKEHPTSIHHATIPMDLSDFGQKQCQSYLEKKINLCKEKKQLHDNDPLIIYASSQGTATAINYVAKNPTNIKALILESVMLTGNGAVEYAFTGDTNTSAGYYSLPYVAKIKFHNYSPLGEQPINNLDALPSDIPIILLHRINDCDLPCKNAQALYAYLTKIRNNQYVYLFTQEKEKHFNLLGKDDKRRIHAINSILALHKALLYHSKKEHLTPDQLKKYQPEVLQEWLDHFYTTLKKEKNMIYADRSIKAIVGAVIAYTLMSYLKII